MALTFLTTVDRTELEAKISEKSIGRVIVLPERNIACDTAYGSTGYYSELIIGREIESFPITVGQPYTVVWGGVKHVRTAVQRTVTSGQSITSYISLGGVGEDPFTINYYQNSGSVRFISQNGTASVTVSIYQDVMDSILPAVSASDNDEVLRVVDGKWAAAPINVSYALTDEDIATIVGAVIAELPAAEGSGF